MRASFNGFAPEIFVTDDDGTYVLRDDCDTLDIIHDVLINFAEGVDQIRLYAGYTFSVEFVLKDGALYQVELYYYIDGYFRRTLTYGAWDDTEMPISFDNFETKSVLDDYAGTYTDGTVTAVIDGSGIVIDDEPYEITEYSIQYDMFTGEWNDGVWYIAKQGAKQLIIFSTEEDITYVLTSTAIDPVEIPDEFDGVWSKNSNTVAIAYDMVEYNGAMLPVLSYDDKDGSLYATDGDKTYRMFAEEDTNDNPVLLVIVYVDGLSTAYYDMTKVEDAVILPEVFVGTFEKYDSWYDTNFKVVITLTTIEIYFDDDKLDSTISSIDYDGYWEITLDVDGEDYYISEGYSANQIGLMSFGSYRFSATLDKVTSGGGQPQPPAPSATIPEAFYGTFEGKDSWTNKTATVVISADGVTVSIDGGTPIVATDLVVTEEEYWGVKVWAASFKINGNAYSISEGSNADSISIYSDFDGGMSFQTTLTRANGTGSDDDKVDIPEKFYGYYMGNSGSTYYGVTIDADGIVVELNGNAQETVVLEYGDYWGEYINITINGVDYGILDPEEEDGQVTQITLACSDPELSITLTRLDF